MINVFTKNIHNYMNNHSNLISFQNQFNLPIVIFKPFQNNLFEIRLAKVTVSHGKERL